jgi:hypothetical protein
MKIFYSLDNLSFGKNLKVGTHEGWSFLIYGITLKEQSKLISLKKRLINAISNHIRPNLTNHFR